MKNSFRQLAALNRALSIIQAIDDERFQWMMDSTHYSFKLKGKYSLTIWTENEETAILLRNDINKYIMQDSDSIEIAELDSQKKPYTISITIEY